MIKESYYYLYNGHADVTALIEKDGSIAATYYYNAFGNILISTGDVNNILYLGYQYDSETGLYYLNARMYDPKIARFLQMDTNSGNRNDPLSLNLYTYCMNNPMRYFDPTGHVAELLKKGSTGNDVVQLQKMPIFEGYAYLRFYRGSSCIIGCFQRDIWALEFHPVSSCDI